jgi:hypothetical protein
MRRFFTPTRGSRLLSACAEKVPPLSERVRQTALLARIILLQTAGHIAPATMILVWRGEAEARPAGRLVP